MKKVFVFLLAAMLLLSSVSLAGELSSLSDEELMELYTHITGEMADRNMSIPEPSEAQPETSGGTVLFYSPEGGRYYHRDQNCRTVHKNYLPLSGMFLYSELEDEAYKDLLPCTVCGAPVRQEARSLPMSFRGAVEAADGIVSIGGDIDYISAVMEQDGKNIRIITLLDDHARQLYMTAMAAEAPSGMFEAFDEYAWSLPVSYTEEITAKPKEQAELDAQAGRTIGELIKDGYVLYGSGGGIYVPTTVDLSCGLFNYEFEVDASFEEYQEHQDRDDLESLQVKSGKRSGFSSAASNPDFLADGSYDPPFIPHVSAEEAAAADSVPPPEEYTAKAWPVTAESYADLLGSAEGRYGQVYLVTGTVHQVLSQSPVRVIINTGEGGKPQPVVVEFPEPLTFDPEAGSSWRIYADVTSSCYILPVLTARYIYYIPAAEAADEEDFTVPGAVPAADAGDFAGEWHYFRIVNEDGTEMNRDEMEAEGIVDDRAEIVITESEIKLYTASLGDAGSVKFEFVPEDGSLKILNDSEEPPVLRLTDNGMLMLFMPSGGSSGSTTAYLIRNEP